MSGLSRPASSAASIRATPRRSLTLAAGLKDSSLATTSAPTPSVTRFSRTSGVFPTSWVMFSAMLTDSNPTRSRSPPSDVEVDCNVSGYRQGDRGESLWRPVQRHSGQHPAGRVVRCCCGQGGRRCARRRSNVEVASRLDRAVDSDAVRVDHCVTIGNVERQREFERGRGPPGQLRRQRAGDQLRFAGSRRAASAPASK